MSIANEIIRQLEETDCGRDDELTTAPVKASPFQEAILRNTASELDSFLRS